jgi:N-acetylglucosaminyldiphosphoundecaprenol N-acetyl-beta-D-mannosaminyltransferase
MTAANAFPVVIPVDDIPITAFDSFEALYARVIAETQTPKQSILAYLNVHVANVAAQNAGLKTFLKEADCIYADGAGIVLASRLFPTPKSSLALPMRLTGADFFPGLLTALAQAQKTVFLLGGAQGTPEACLKALNAQGIEHSIVGTHHGYILHDAQQAQNALWRISQAKPDVLIVGMGTPLQEKWIAEHQPLLKEIPVIYALGAVMDYFAGVQPRCPWWMGKLGLEWLYRLTSDPGRLAGRYLIGNPMFFARVFLSYCFQ